MSKIEKRKQLLLKLIREEKVMFWVGPRLSTEQGLVHPREMLRNMAECFLPQKKQYEDIVKKVSSRIQAEIFYEELLYLDTNAKQFDIFKLYSTSFLKKLNIPILYNKTHLFLIEYAFNAGIPIFTTNVDTLLEDACIELNYNYKVIILNEQFPKKLDISQYKEKQVIIVKLNGSINIKSNNTVDLNSLNLTFNELYKNNHRVAELLSNSLENLQSVFIGYQGMEIDNFPHLNDIFEKHHSLLDETKDANRYFWLDPVIETHSPLRQDFISSEKTTIINWLYAGAQKIPEHASKILKPTIHTKEKSFTIPTTIRKDLGKIKIDILDKFYQKNNVTHYESLLLLLLVSKRISAYPSGYELSNQLLKDIHLLSPKKQAIFYNMRAAYLHNRGTFITFRKNIKQIIKLYKAHPDLYWFALKAKTSLAESSRMLYVNPGTLDGNYKMVSILIGAIFTILHFRYTSLIIKKYQKQLNNTSKLSIVETIVLRSFIEHDIRFYGMIQHIYIRKLRRKNKYLKKLLEKRWNEIEAISREKGYLGGIGNVQKYQVSLQGDKSLTQKEEGQHLFNFMTDQIGQEQINLNQSYNNQLVGNHLRAKKIAIEVYKNALKSQNNLNIIKALSNIVKCNEKLGVKPLLNSEQYKILKDTSTIIEGYIWKKKINKLIRNVQKSKNDIN